LAAVCIEKIVESGGTEAEAILSRQTDRLQAALSELEEEVAVTKRVTPRRAWEHPPGSPGWRAASRRAAKAVARLLA
ncbi:MAG: hypothetical protein JSV79_07900, partial [Armatimonadota bacterium]